MFLDWDGNRVEFAEDATPEFIDDYNEAKEYLEDGDLFDIISQVENHDGVIYIEESTDIGEFRFVASERTIYFNPKSGLEVAPNKVQSPALGLLHELGHALRFLEDIEGLRKDLKTEDKKFKNYEEKRVIEEIETPAAFKLGEPVRFNHGGKKVEVHGPTSRIKK